MLFQPKNVRWFNCYSYAMNECKTWINCRKDIEELEKIFYPWKFLRNGTIDELVEIFVKKDVLVNFPEFKIIKQEEIKKNTRLVAVKMSSGDFHFMKRFPNGHWFHKMASKDIEPIKKEIVFSDEWFDKYNSKTVFLGYKEDYE